MNLFKCKTGLDRNNFFLVFCRKWKDAKKVTKEFAAEQGQTIFDHELITLAQGRELVGVELIAEALEALETVGPPLQSYSINYEYLSRPRK